MQRCSAFSMGVSVVALWETLDVLGTFRGSGLRLRQHDALLGLGDEYGIHHRGIRP
jgi:hypothetical protein